VLGDLAEVLADRQARPEPPAECVPNTWRWQRPHRSGTTP